MENKKIEKGKNYTYEELREIYREAMTKTIANPFGEAIEDERLKKEVEDPKFQLTTMLSGMMVLHTMEGNLFDKEVD